MREHPKAILTTTQGWNKPNRDGYESRKNNIDDIWLNPTCQKQTSSFLLGVFILLKMGNPQPSLE